MKRMVVTVLASILVLGGCSASGAVASQGGPGEAHSPSSFAASPTTVVLDVGCWVENLEVDGETWALTQGQQFGWGDVPRSWEGRGHVKRLDDSRLRYVDQGGQRLVFIPADSRKAFDLEGSYCY